VGPPASVHEGFQSMGFARVPARSRRATTRVHHREDIRITVIGVVDNESDQDGRREGPGGAWLARLGERAHGGIVVEEEVYE